MNWGTATVTAIAAVFIAGIGIILTMLQLRRQTRQLKLELGNLYLMRYWQIDDDLLISIKGTEDHGRHRHRYLRLCEDEFEAAGRKWLESGQWAVWHEWLVSPQSIGRLVSDLNFCDPGVTRFNSIRKCIAQVHTEGRVHSAGTCDSRAQYIRRS